MKHGPHVGRSKFKGMLTSAMLAEDGKISVPIVRKRTDVSADFHTDRQPGVWTIKK
jgi:hypothetical protein